MRSGFGWIAALTFAFGVAGGAGGATLPPELALPLQGNVLPAVGAPPASFESTSSEGTLAREGLPEPAALMLLATGLAGLLLLGHPEFS